MKVAIIGTGKTGSKVFDLLKDFNPGVFNTKNPPDLNKLKSFDVIICFIPGQALIQLLDLFLESNIPVVCGATGFNWPIGFNQNLLHKKLRWIYSSNFSLGMHLVHTMIDTLKHTSKLFDHYHYTLHEIHHTEKKDSPSGTSKMWASWLDEEVKISSERIGDVVGTHNLTLNTPYEQISIKHVALDRKIFAQGAIWAANEVLSNKNLNYGLIDFNDLIKNKLRGK